VTFKLTPINKPFQPRKVVHLPETNKKLADYFEHDKSGWEIKRKKTSNGKWVTNKILAVYKMKMSLKSTLDSVINDPKLITDRIITALELLIECGWDKDGVCPALIANYKQAASNVFPSPRNNAL
jgi:hypothetical protein